MSRPLTIVRRSLRKDGKSARLPWVFRCGCGLRSQCDSFERGLFHLRYHGCDDFHP